MATRSSFPQRSTSKIARDAAFLKLCLAIVSFAWVAPPTHVFAGPHGGAAPAASANTGSLVVGQVAETMDAAGYTYVRVEADGESVWAAGPTVALAVGDTVSFSREMPMRNFKSESLGRTFETVYFVSAIRKSDGAKDAPASPGGDAPATGAKKAVSPAGPHAGLGRSEGGAEPDLSGIEKADGGKTIGEIYDSADSLHGETVAVRGKVVKANLGVMGKNWFHLRDGSAGAKGENDLTVTSDGQAKVGDVVVVRGTLRTDVDLGFGYHYDVIVEQASIAKD